MRINRVLLPAALVVVALVIQVSVLSRLHLPGAVPDLLLLVVLALAMTYGHVEGALIGFGAGLLADLAPPADHAAGRFDDASDRRQHAGGQQGVSGQHDDVERPDGADELGLEEDDEEEDGRRRRRR